MKLKLYLCIFVVCEAAMINICSFQLFGMSYKYYCNHLHNTVNILNVINLKEGNTCSDCDYSGSKLWICLYKNCSRIGCSDEQNHHCTLHFSKYPKHFLYMNVESRKLWCYACNAEMFMESMADCRDIEVDITIYPEKSTSKQEISSVINFIPVKGAVDRTHLFEKNLGLNFGSDGYTFDRQLSSLYENTELNSGLHLVNYNDAQDFKYRLDIFLTEGPLASFSGGDYSDYSDSDGYDDVFSDKPAGLVGLQNIGNTCYMNAALQALSNAPPLTRFFLDCSATVQLLSEDKKPGLSRAYQSLMRDIWMKKNGGYVSASGILYGIRLVHPIFRGYHQHDTQEFLRNFMDQLHEELKQQCLVDSIHQAPLSEEATMSSSCDSSEGEYETCDSGVSERSSLSDDIEKPSSNINRNLDRSSSPGRSFRARVHNSGVIDYQPAIARCSFSSISPTRKQIKYRSIISDIFDGKILSSVQCLTCNRISCRVETFQDVSLPIPSKDHLILLHGRVPPGATCSESVIPFQDGWISWIFNWFKSWFYGPTVTLHDCLAAFFSTDELKGDNMYSCEKCSKLRNGIKFSKVLQLPEVLCIHLKRFRHELMFSSKISSSVSFPLKGLEIKPYLHKDCISKVSNYDLFSVICHHGTAGGGHYISFALNNKKWYEFDDQYVTEVSPEKVENCEAYVLFYRKSTARADEIKMKVINMSEIYNDEEIEIAYVSKQWMNKFNTCAEPGPIDNSDFLCQHKSMSPDKVSIMNHLSVVVPLTVYEYLHKIYGGCPPITCVHVCPTCQMINKRRRLEMETLSELTESANRNVPATHLLSLSWYNKWHNFVSKKVHESPGVIDNSKININQIDMNEFVNIPEKMWNFFHNIYGGGPEIRMCENSSEISDSENMVNEEMSIVTIPIPNPNQQESTEIFRNIYYHDEPMSLSEGSEKEEDTNEESDKDHENYSSDESECCTKLNEYMPNEVNSNLFSSRFPMCSDDNTNVICNNNYSQGSSDSNRS